MKCASCDQELLPREKANPVRVMGKAVSVPSFCDECCRKHPWRGGSKESLDRFEQGKLDVAEVQRLGEIVAQWGGLEAFVGKGRVDGG